MNRKFMGVAALLAMGAGCISASPTGGGAQHGPVSTADPDSDEMTRPSTQGVWTIETKTDRLTDEKTVSLRAAGEVLPESDSIFNSFSPLIVMTCGSTKDSPAVLRLAALGADGRSKSLSAGYGMLRVDKGVVHEAPWRSRSTLNSIEFSGDFWPIFDEMRGGEALVLRVREDVQRLDASFSLRTFSDVAIQFEATCRSQPES